MAGRRTEQGPLVHVPDDERRRIDVGLAAATSPRQHIMHLSITRRNGPRGDPSPSRSSAAQVPFRHPDIKRMLLFQKGIVEGFQSLLMQCAYYYRHGKNYEGEEHENYNLLLELLTPVAKRHPSECILSTSAAIQILGGYGFCEEFPVEQYYRDTRIHPIHEGTTGIQAMDLLGRKVTIKKGKAFTLYLEELNKTIKMAEAIPSLAAATAELKRAAEILHHVTGHPMELP